MKAPFKHQITADFFNLFKLKNVDKIYAFLKQLPENEKKNLSDDIKSIIKKVFNWNDNDDYTSTGEEAGLNRLYVFLGVITFCNWTEISKLNWVALRHVLEDHVKEYIAWLNPDWLDKFAEKLMKENVRYFDDVRYFYKKGLIQKPTTDSYFIGLLNKPNTFHHKEVHEQSLYDFLVENEDILREDLWHLFEIDGTSDISLSNIDRFSFKANWNVTFKLLSQKGLLERQRLLAECLNALKRDFIQYRSGWFSKFHEFMEPTIEERITFQEQYLLLLRSSIMPTVSFTLNALSLIQKSNRLNESKFIEYIVPVLSSDKQSIVKQALTMLENIAKSTKALHQNVCLAASNALLSDSVDIQQKVFKILDKYGSKNDAGLIGLILAFKDNIKPSLIPILNNWIPEDDKTHHAEINVSEPKTTEPLLQDANRIEEIKNIDDLLFLASKVLEDPSDIGEVESFIGGLSVLGNEKTENFNEKIKPLLKRTSYWDKNDFCFMRGYLSDLIKSWASGFKTGINFNSPYRETINPYHFLFIKRRLQFIILHLQKKKPYALLAMPTHRPYWIHPSVLVEKIIQYQTSGIPINHHELSLAITRLAPEDRKQAMVKASAISGETGNIIRFVLGEEPKAPYTLTSIWCNAARTREPFGSFEFIKKFQEANFPETAEKKQLTYSIILDTETSYHHDKIRTNRAEQLVAEKDVKESLLLYSLYYQKVKEFEYTMYEYTAFYDIKWKLSFTPNLQEAYYAFAVEWISSTVSYSEVSDKDAKAFLENLLNPHIPIFPMAELTIAVSLTSAEKILRSFATEVLISTIEDKRLNLQTFGKNMGMLMSSNYTRLNRVLDCYNAIASVSKLHGQALESIIMYSILELKEIMPKNLKTLLELLYELTLRNNTIKFDALVIDKLNELKNNNNLKKISLSLLYEKSF